MSPERSKRPEVPRVPPQTLEEANKDSDREETARLRNRALETDPELMNLSNIVSLAASSGDSSLEGYKKALEDAFVRKGL
ncbi:MAG TPA: hypothetical protein VJH06_02905 [Candidatus Paceibacterota bacterium]